MNIKNEKQVQLHKTMLRGYFIEKSHPTKDAPDYLMRIGY